jgi:hypothetical protein
MTCAGCDYDRQVERLSLQGRYDDEVAPAEHTCGADARPVEILLVAPGALGHGRPFTFDSFDVFALYISRPTFMSPTGDAEADKATEGGLVCGAFRGGRRRKADFLGTRAMSFDFDDCDVETVARSVVDLSTCVHETFKSRAGARRCRLYVELLERVEDVGAFDAAHDVLRKHFAARGIVADESAKDCSRLNYLPVRAIGTGYQFTRTRGKPLDVARMLAVQPPPPPRPPPKLAPLPQHRDKYIAAALTAARANVAAATPGGRHLALCREAFSLARLGLSEGEIAHALIPAFVATSGETRRREAERAVHDAVAARGQS